MGFEEWLDGAKPHLAMILMGAGYGGYFVLTKASLSEGVDPFVYSTYREGIGCGTLFLYALYFERQQWRKISLQVAGLILVMGFVEEVAVSRRDGQAKVLGILFCVAGATILTLYKGPALFGDSTTMAPPTTVSLGAFLSVLQGWEIDQWRLGALFLIADSFFCAAFINLQVPAVKRFPASFTLMSLAVLIGGIMFATTALFRWQLEPSAWILSRGPDLVAVIYAGLVASGLCLYLQYWATHKSGPIFVAAYTPVQPLFSTFFGALFLGDALFFGSVLGATLILSGLSLVIWGIRENLRWKTLPFRIPTLGNHSIDAVKPTSLLVEPLLS